MKSSLVAILGLHFVETPLTRKERVEQSISDFFHQQSGNVSPFRKVYGDSFGFVGEWNHIPFFVPLLSQLGKTKSLSCFVFRFAIMLQHQWSVLTKMSPSAPSPSHRKSKTTAVSWRVRRKSMG